MSKMKKEIKIKENTNIAKCFITLSVIFLIISFCFFPLAFITYKGDKYFIGDSFEAILMYVFLTIFLIFLIIGLTIIIKNNRKRKNLNSEN